MLNIGFDPTQTYFSDREFLRMTGHNFIRRQAEESVTTNAHDTIGMGLIINFFIDDIH